MRVVMAMAAALLLAGCGDAVTRTGADEGLEGRTFLSESTTDSGEPFELVEGTQIRLEFRDDGELRVDAGCNHLMADVVVGDEALEIAGVGLSRG